MKMLHVVTMKTRTNMSILIPFLLTVLCIYLNNTAYNLTFKERGSVIGQKQILLNGKQKNLVLNKQLESFVRGHPTSVIKGKELFNTSLSQVENERIFVCQTAAEYVLKREFAAFDQDRQICMNHHSYLKENDSILIEIGGNLGEDASLFTAIYNPRHLIVEPLEDYANLLKERFKENKRVTVLNFGLRKETGIAFMEMDGEASNVNSKTGNTVVDIINSTEFFQNIGVGIFSVDLLTMDCEGCELDVLENLLESGLVKYFKNIQYEQHSMTGFVNREEYLRRYCTLQEYMQRTHRLTFQYKHVWENWRLLDLK